jgi:integrase
MAKMGFITKTELPVVMAKAKERSLKHHCLFLIKYWHGLRVSEISRLKVSDIRNGYLDVRRSKNSLHTEQPLHSHSNPLFDTPAVLAAWLAERSKQCGIEDNPYLFTKQRKRKVSSDAMAKRQSGDYSRQALYNDIREVLLAL